MALSRRHYVVHALREGAHIVLVLRCRIIQARAYSCISFSRRDEIATKHSDSLRTQVALGVISALHLPLLQVEHLACRLAVHPAEAHGIDELNGIVVDIRIWRFPT